MCGIIGYSGNKNAASIVLEGLKKLEYRGYDSFGIAIWDEDDFGITKKIGQIGKAKLSDLKQRTGNTAIGHTRWATHGDVSERNAHPFVSQNERFILAHNGIIENYLDLKELVKGYSFKSDTDSEVFLALVEKFSAEEPFVDAIREAYNRVIGRNAFVVFDRKNNQFAAVKKGMPLVIGIGEHEIFVASDVVAFLEHTKTTVFLDDNCIAHYAKVLRLLDVKSGAPVPIKPIEVDWGAEQAQKGEYAHFMLKEIFEQKESLHKVSKDFDKASFMVKEAKKVFLVACGSAYHSALVGKEYLAKDGILATAIAASEFYTIARFVDHSTVVIAISQSGETSDTNEAIEIAKSKGAKIISLVNVPGSTLVRLSDNVLYTNSGPEIGVASTKAFVGQVLQLFYLSKSIAAKDNIIHLSKLNESLGDISKSTKILADKIKNKEHIFCIGKGILYPIALESALKIKEVSYIHAEGFAEGELKHGVIALIEKGSPCIIFAGIDSHRNVAIAGGMEMKLRGGFIIGISPKNDPSFDYFIEIPDLGELLPIACTIPSQFLAYYLALFRNLDPDKPRNLAKVVTVK